MAPNVRIPVRVSNARLMEVKLDRSSFLLLPLALVVAGCNSGSDSDEEAVKQTVLAALKDPDSAKFGRTAHVSIDAVCIEVNAKNSFGGYSGNTTFAVKRNDQGAWLMGLEFEGANGFSDCQEDDSLRRALTE